MKAEKLYTVYDKEGTCCLVGNVSDCCRYFNTKPRNIYTVIYKLKTGRIKSMNNGYTIFEVNIQ